jgi:Methyltransferase domain
MRCGGGLSHGMRVLELGTDGVVVGIERAAASVQGARGRAESLGVANIRFEQS